MTAMTQIEEYTEELQRLVELLKPLMPALAVSNVDVLQRAPGLLDTLGPVLAPSEYLHGGMKNVDEQREFIDAVLPLILFAQKGFTS